MPNGLDIVAQCMQFVSQHVESTQLGSFTCSATHCPWFGSFGAPVSCMSCCFTRDIICLEVGTTLAQELVKHLTKVPCTIAKMERLVSVCIQIFPNACQVVSSKRRLRTMLLYGSGSKPLKTGIEH